MSKGKFDTGNLEYQQDCQDSSDSGSKLLGILFAILMLVASAAICVASMSSFAA